MVENQEVPPKETKKQEILSRIDEELEKRGIRDIEVGEEEEIKIEILDLSSSDKKRENIRSVMEKLGIPENSQTTIRRRIVKFKEDISKGILKDEFPDRSLNQEFAIYTIHPQGNEYSQSNSIEVFIPGATVRDKNTLQSSYTALLQAQAEKNGIPLFFYTFDYRGSGSVEENQNFCMVDGDADALIATKVALENHDKHFSDNRMIWNGILTLVGNSKGGDVAVNISPDVQPDKLVLLQAAAYSEESRTMHFAGPGGSLEEQDNPFGAAIRKKDSWKMAPAFDRLEEYMKQGGDSLIVGAEEDRVVTGDISRRYMKEVTYSYVDSAVRAEGLNSYDVGYLWIPESHTSTTDDEVERVIEKSNK